MARWQSVGRSICILFRSVLVVENQPNRAITNGREFTASLRCVRTDGPMRNYLKRTKGHAGYYSCDRCIQRSGQFPVKEKRRKSASTTKVKTSLQLREQNAPLRRDAHFFSRILRMVPTTHRKTTICLVLMMWAPLQTFHSLVVCLDILLIQSTQCNIELLAELFHPWFTTALNVDWNQPKAQTDPILLSKRIPPYSDQHKQDKQLERSWVAILAALHWASGVQRHIVTSKKLAFFAPSSRNPTTCETSDLSQEMDWQCSAPWTDTFNQFHQGIPGVTWMTRIKMLIVQLSQFRNQSRCRE